jgi:hypothetical protein
MMTMARSSVERLGVHLQAAKRLVRCNALFGGAPKRSELTANKTLLHLEDALPSAVGDDLEMGR